MGGSVKENTRLGARLTVTEKKKNRIVAQTGSEGHGECKGSQRKDTEQVNVGVRGDIRKTSVMKEGAVSTSGLRNLGGGGRYGYDTDPRTKLEEVKLPTKNRWNNLVGAGEKMWLGGLGIP